MNSVNLIGRVGQEPKVNEGESGRKVVRLSLATTERGFVTKSGKKIEDRTEWHTLVFFGNIRNVIQNHVKTGSLIAIRGSIHYAKWEDSEKNIRYTTEIWCTDLELLGKKNEEDKVEPEQFKTPEDELPF